MALTDAFLNTCRTSVAALSELTAYRAALVPGNTGEIADRRAAWHATFTPGTDGRSPARTLSQAIRGVVGAQADASGALGALDRESAVRTLESEYMPTVDKPATNAEYQAALDLLFARS